MAPLKQKWPGTQSASDSHGKAHLPAATLHRWATHIASLVQGSAAGPGVASGPLDAGGGEGATSADGGVDVDVTGDVAEGCA